MGSRFRKQLSGAGLAAVRSSFRQQVWGTALGNSFVEQAWRPALGSWSSFEQQLNGDHLCGVALERNFGKQLSGTALENSFGECFGKQV